MDNEKVYTIKEAAEYLRVTERAMYDFIKDGRLKAAKVGRVWRIRQSWIYDFLEKQISKPEDDI